MILGWSLANRRYAEGSFSSMSDPPLSVPQRAQRRGARGVKARRRVDHDVGFVCGERFALFPLRKVGLPARIGAGKGVTRARRRLLSLPRFEPRAHGCLFR